MNSRLGGSSSFRCFSPLSEKRVQGVSCVCYTVRVSQLYITYRRTADGQDQRDGVGWGGGVGLYHES